MKHKRYGFSLVEVLISIFLIGLISIAILPAFDFATQQIKHTEVKSIANTIANEQIEILRGVNFDDLGVVDGNPDGNIIRNSTIVRDGHSFNVEIDVRWFDSGVGNVDWDYKDITVRVTSQAVLSTSQPIDYEIKTSFSRDHTIPLNDNANLRVTVFNGWLRGLGMEVPIAGVPITFNNQLVTTGLNGIATFVDVDPGISDLSINLNSLGMIQRGTALTTFDVIDEQSNFLEVEVERPCELLIRFLLSDGTPVVLENLTNVSFELNKPYGPNSLIQIDQTDEDGFFNSPDLQGLWPVGTGYLGNYSFQSVLNGSDLVLDLEIPGYTLPINPNLNYPIDTATNAEWDGTFINPGSIKTVIIYLDSIPRLNEMTVSKGVMLPNFNPERERYDVYLPNGTTEIPSVSFDAPDGCDVLITNATLFDEKTIVRVTQPSNNTFKEYSISFIVNE